MKLKDYQNLTMGIQMQPSLTNIFLDLTLYEEYSNIINNYTKIIEYNYKSFGLGSTMLYGGKINRTIGKNSLSYSAVPR